MSAAAKTAPYGEASVILTRVFDASRALVWKAWTDPNMMAQWFGPRGFTNPVCELDVRVGGSLRIMMRGPDGSDYPIKGVFREVVAPERLVFTNIAFDKEGKHLLEGETTVTFAESNNKTTLTPNSRSRSHSDRSANARRYGGGVVAKHRQTSRTGDGYC